MYNLSKEKIKLIQKLFSLSVEEQKQARDMAQEIINRRTRKQARQEKTPLK